MIWLTKKKFQVLEKTQHMSDKNPFSKGSFDYLKRLFKLKKDMEKLPEKIYLQCYDRNGDLIKTDLRTHSEERINKNDAEYYRIEKHPPEEKPDSQDTSIIGVYDALSGQEMHAGVFFNVYDKQWYGILHRDLIKIKYWYYPPKL